LRWAAADQNGERRPRGTSPCWMLQLFERRAEKVTSLEACLAATWACPWVGDPRVEQWPDRRSAPGSEYVELEKSSALKTRSLKAVLL